MIKTDKMNEQNIQERMKLVEAMDTVIKALNNEEAMDGWYALGPGDGAEQEEYRAVAEEIEPIQLSEGIIENSVYEDCCRAFVRTIIYYANDGFFCGMTSSQTMKNKEFIEILKRSIKCIESEE